MSNFKISTLLGPVFSSSNYFKHVLSRKLNKRVIIPASTEQQPSTQATLDRDPSKDEEHFNRPMVDAQVLDENGNIFFNTRTLDFEQVRIVEDIRRKARNQLGQPDLSGASPLTRANAVMAFMAAGSVDLTEYEKTTIREFYKCMEFPDAPVTADSIKIITEFNNLLERNGMLEKVKI